MRLIGEPLVAREVVERRFDVSSEGREVPGILWTPEAATGPRPLVLLGHGGTLHKRSDYLLGLARRLVRHHGYAALSIDGPVHGDRRSDDGLDLSALNADFDAVWRRPESPDEMIADWKCALEAVRALPEVGEGAIAYWGLSMGTIFGLPLVAAEPRIQVAVLGLMGTLGPTAKRLAEDAPKLRCPVLFLQQWEDELVPGERLLRLFGAIGSADKRLHANPGKHSAVPAYEVRASEDFLAHHLERS